MCVTLPVFRWLAGQVLPPYFFTRPESGTWFSSGVTSPTLQQSAHNGLIKLQPSRSQPKCTLQMKCPLTHIFLSPFRYFSETLPGLAGEASGESLTVKVCRGFFLSAAWLRLGCESKQPTTVGPVCLSAGRMMHHLPGNPKAISLWGHAGL